MFYLAVYPAFMPGEIWVKLVRLDMPTRSVKSAYQDSKLRLFFVTLNSHDCQSVFIDREMHIC